MTDQVEQVAERIYAMFPTTIEGLPVDWGSVVRNYPIFADEYRKIARWVIQTKEAGPLAEPKTA